MKRADQILPEVYGTTLKRAEDRTTLTILNKWCHAQLTYLKVNKRIFYEEIWREQISYAICSVSVETKLEHLALSMNYK